MAKSTDAFRTISEAAEELDLPQHVLRHWEDIFGSIRPMRRAGGRRYYRTHDIELLSGVKALLHDERYTTKGVQKIFKEQGAQYVADIGRRALDGEPFIGATSTPPDLPDLELTRSGGEADLEEERKTTLRQELQSVVSRLEALQDRLDDALIAIESIAVEDEAMPEEVDGPDESTL